MPQCQPPGRRSGWSSVSGSLVARDGVLILLRVNGFPIDSLNLDIGARV